MSQSCFSLGFFSQNSLWKLSTIRGYKGYLYWCVFRMQKVIFFPNRVVWRLGLATRLSCEFESRANCLARLKVLSCSATTGVTLQLLYMLHTCSTFDDSPVERSSREALLECTFLSFSSHFLTHYPYMIPT